MFKRILLTIKENWKDPVWSKVISAVILGIGTLVLTTAYSLLKAIFSEISFMNVFKEIYDFFSSYVSVSIWMLFLLIFIYLNLIFTPIIKFCKQITAKVISPKTVKEKFEEYIPKANEHSTSLFHYRMAGAFPGVRGLKWFDDPKIAAKRLEILLQEPLKYSDGSIHAESDPIWWFRGGSALFIKNFKRMGGKKVLLNSDQLKIKRIAAYQGDSYYQDFVYVEVEGENQTGLYSLKQEDIKRHIETFGYSWEEYGLIKNKFGWTTPIRREDYDDGATVVRGKVIDTRGAKLRRRYLSDYNFIIAAKGSPYNSNKFDRDSKVYLNGILKGEIKPEDFFDYLKTFNKKEQ